VLQDGSERLSDLGPNGRIGPIPIARSDLRLTLNQARLRYVLVTMTDAISPAPARSKLFSALIGLVSLDIVLQGVWAGIFIREGKDNNDHWVSIHAHGADVGIVIAIIALILAVARLRSRRDLIIGTVALVVLLILEAYLGGKIGDHPAVEAVHFPLALGLMGLAVWLPLRSRQT
jgi:hypothetical protein